MTRRCMLDVAVLKTEDAAYDALAGQLRLPAHFGRNLDALWDSLTTDVPGPVEIVVANRAAAPQAMRGFWQRLCGLLAEAAAERPDLAVVER